MTHRDSAGDELVPISVRLGEVVPPEDPEDWTRPLTWVAALGMLAGPLVAVAWFVAAPPTDGSASVPMTRALAVALTVGAAATGATQIGAARAGTATLGAGLFACLVTIMAAVMTAGERQAEAASPIFSHGVAAAAGGLAGSTLAAVIAAIVARVRSRIVRLGAAAVAGGALAVAALALVLPA